VADADAVKPAGPGAPDPAADRASKVVRPAIQELSAYHVPLRGDHVKLDAMENPYPLPPALREEWLEVLRDAEINRYPDAGGDGLKAALRTAFGIPESAAILPGNGSDEIIQIIAMAVDGPILAPTPTFVMYEIAARFVDKEFVPVPLDGDFGLDLDAMLSVIRQHKPAVAFIAYPNNPTGNLFDESILRRVIDAAPGLVVIDEAYHAFAERTWMHSLEEFPNLLVMRTLSKLGLAGLRFGFAAAHPAWIDHFDKVRMPYNINTLTQKSVEFALARLDVFQQQTERIKAERGRVFDALKQAGYECFPTSTNFILFRTRALSAGDVYGALLDNGVLIKNLSESHSTLTNCLRVTIGTPEENNQFLAALPRER
jgi:histidinol-phosphate aminotransferase